LSVRARLAGLLLALSTVLAVQPAAALDARTMGVVINDADPYSVAIGRYFVQQRAIPSRNVVHVSFPVVRHLTPEQFAPVAQALDRAMPAAVQALAIAWTTPYRVGCMSVTSAFAFGYDAQACAEGCRLTPRSAYFDSDSTLPYTELGVRPSMLLAGSSPGAGRFTIDQGVAADASRLEGTAYLLSTTDPARNVRAAGFPAALRLATGDFHVDIRRANELRDANDVLFYFTGLSRVSSLATLRFRAGAIADHLTSNGGELIGSPQMSSLAWLDAGATASFGTVVEPCAFPQKFPQPAIVMRRYLAGETLIESYWKSVASPSQGVFIGEPLARVARH
jgi:uncharacterized protein (TIGR03790 family)